MLRSIAILFSLFASFVILSNTTTAVAAPAGYYSAVPAVAPEAGKSVVRGLVWSCDGAACAAAEGTSRPAIICASVARELGALTSFRAGDELFDEAALAKCNARAKPVATELVQR